MKFRARGKGRAKAAHYVDSELPTSEKASSWRLAGHDTEPETVVGAESAARSPVSEDSEEHESSLSESD